MGGSRVEDRGRETAREERQHVSRKKTVRFQVSAPRGAEHEIKLGK